MGQWFYEILAGIAPTASGYLTVEIKPHISASVGPSSVEAVVHTVRGPVFSNWTRHTSTQARKGQNILSMSVQIPAGVQNATVRVPLLGLAVQQAEVKLQQPTASLYKSSAATLWDGTVASRVFNVLSSEVVVAADGNDALELVVGAGLFHIAVFSL